MHPTRLPVRRTVEPTTVFTRRDRRIISICGAASSALDEEVTEQLRAALTLGDMTRQELEELVVHFAVYLGWNLARRLDDLLG